MQRFFISTSKDMTARIYSLHPIEEFTPITLAGHRNYVIGAYFSSDQETVSNTYFHIFNCSGKTNNLQFFTLDLYC